MISYKPLMETLLKKGKSVYWLQEQIGSHDLRAILNSNRYLSLKTIDAICKVLECTISRVCEYAEGEQDVKEIVRNKSYLIKADAVKKLIKEKGKSELECSVEMGHKPLYISSVLNRGKVGYQVLRQFTDYFNVDSSVLCK